MLIISATAASSQKGAAVITDVQDNVNKEASAVAPDAKVYFSY